MFGAIGLVAATLGSVPVDMSFRADCPTAADVARDIEVLIGAPAPDVRVRIEVRDVERGVVADLEYDGPSGTRTRTIPGVTCDEVVNAAAVVVAVGVDPVAVQQTIEPILQRPTAPPRQPALAPPPPLPPVERADDNAPEVESTPPAVDEDRADSRSSDLRRPSLGAFARAGVGVGGLPSATGWVGGGLQLGLGGFRGELSGQHLFAQRIRHSNERTTGADVSLTSGRVAACWTPRIGAFTLGGCAGFDAGASRGQGFGLERSGTASVLWLAVTPGLRAHWHPTSSLFVGASLDVPISVVRPRLSIDDFEPPLVELGLAGVLAGVSIGFTFFDESPPRRR